ncbi:DegT/DnrJ/EryC1/StrS family aminotransferase [bacterium]|nr:DegT/DnrJ/EryC1/StrS family aminotransferase [bacterium]
MRETFLPFALPDIDESELDEIREALESNWITTGPKTKLFEKHFAESVGAGHAVAVNSCTAAMHLALEAAGVGPGDEVITSAYTFAATAEVIRYFDATPVLADISALDFNIDPDKIEPLINSRTKAVIPIHIGGLPAEMQAILEIAARHDLIVIEDAAHAFQAKYQDKWIGQIGDATCFSFYATKTITTGEGGMITTDRDDWRDRYQVMALHGISKDAWKRYTAEGSWYYEIVAPGYKYNMTDVAAAMGLAQLKKANRMRERREWIANQYHAAFRDCEALQIPYDRKDCVHAWHLYMLRLNLSRLKIDRKQFAEEMKNRNIGISVHFIPLHIHPYYREKYGYRPEDYSIAYGEFSRELSLPIYNKMSDQDVRDVIEAVLDIVKKNTR